MGGGGGIKFCLVGGVMLSGCIFVFSVRDGGVVPSSKLNSDILGICMGAIVFTDVTLLLIGEEGRFNG
jgi:hypothetical protein